ncbi:MAG: M20 family metallo-hydrolase [Calditrichia bacterium]
MDLKGLFKYLDSLSDEMVQFQKEITAIPALGPDNGGKGEWDKAMYIKKYMEEMGLDEVIEVHAPDERAKNGLRPNIIGIYKGKNTEKTVWIMAHTDVVPPGDMSKWHSDPWTLKVEDGKMIGRGTEDNQQGLVSSLFAVKALIDNNVKPEINIGLVYVADEETGNKYGLEYVLSQKKDLFKKGDLIIVPDAGEPDSSMVEVAEKSILWIKFITTGKQCHASTPGAGINAHKANAHLIVKLGELYDKFNLKDETFDPPISTFEPTKKELNVDNVNTIPGEDVFYLDCRILPQYNLEDVLAFVKEKISEIEEEFNVKIALEFPQKVEAANPTPVDAEVVTKLISAVKDVYHVDAKPMGIGGGTVAAEFRKHGYEAAVWSTLEDTCHQPNEYALISNMVNDAKVFVHVCLQK